MCGERTRGLRNKMGKADSGLRPLFRRYLRLIDFVPVESGQTSRGIPDTNYCYRGVEGWIEMKAADHWRVSIRPEQVAWAERRIDHGGRVFVAILRANHELWLYHGSAMRRLLKERIDIVPSLGDWSRGPACWDWANIMEILTNPVNDK
jgi:hypothetical protein